MLKYSLAVRVRFFAILPLYCARMDVPGAPAHQSLRLQVAELMECKKQHALAAGLEWPPPKQPSKSKKPKKAAAAKAPPKAKKAAAAKAPPKVKKSAAPKPTPPQPKVAPVQPKSVSIAPVSLAYLALFKECQTDAPLVCAPVDLDCRYPLPTTTSPTLARAHGNTFQSVRGIQLIKIQLPHSDHTTVLLPHHRRQRVAH
jgi:hypothetical protein